MNKLSPSAQHLRNITPVLGVVDTPEAIYGSDLIAHFRSDTGVTVDGSSRVSNWLDLTGNGHDLAQGVAGNRPDYIASGGPLGRPYVASGNAATNWMQHGGTPMTINTGNWTVFMVASVQAASGATKVYTTTLTTPAGCVPFAFRKSGIETTDVTQLGMSAPVTILSTGGNMLPAPTFVASVATMYPDGTRNLYTAGDGQSWFGTDSHTGSIGIRLAEGYIFRFGGIFYTNLALYELGFVKRTSSNTDASRMRSYARSIGLAV